VAIHSAPEPPATPQLMRTLNERAVLERLRRDGPASRPQLALRAGLSKPTVAAALRHLQSAGLVRPVGQRSPGRGRSALVFEHDPTAGYVAGVAIGQRWIRCAVADLGAAIVARSDVRNTARSASTVVSTASRVAREVAASAGIRWDQVIQTVVGSPGVFDPQDGTLLLASRIRRWGRPSLLDDLSRELGEATMVMNDANLAAVAERAFGRGASARTFVYLLVGTGLGMGVVIDGRLHLGNRGAAGEVAYLPLGEEAGSRASASGTRWGAFEETSSAQGVVRSAVELGMSPRLSALEVFEAARRGNPAARTAVEREAERLALVVASVAAVLDPELVILGGGVGSELDLLVAPMERRLHQLTPFRPEVVSGELGSDAVLLGAIASAVEAAQDQVFRYRLLPDSSGSPSPRSETASVRQERMTSSQPSISRAAAAAPKTPAAFPRVAMASVGGGARVSRGASDARS
jgi:predicted NBD/HSP70 family sugar kinase